MKNSKKIVAVLMVTALVVVASIQTFSSKADKADSKYDTTLKTSPDLFKQVREGYNEGDKGPISIVPAKLNSNNSTKDIYLVMLSGTELVAGLGNGVVSDVQSALDKDNDYLKNIRKVLSKNVPKNTNLVIAGHSLGGMVAQQATGDAAIRDNYNILNVVTFGSPMIIPKKAEGSVQRLDDISDIVPYLSESDDILKNKDNTPGLNLEDGGYGKKMIKAHCKSYSRDEVWGAYDTLGVKKGTSTIEFNKKDVKFHKCPSGFFNGRIEDNKDTGAKAKVKKGLQKAVNGFYDILKK